MRLLPRPVLITAAALLLLHFWAPVRYTSLRAEDLHQLLKAAAEEAKPERDEADSDKTADEEKKDSATAENNGANKDEDTNKPSEAKPAAPTASAQTKPKYPPYAEVIKDAKT